jgi:hypothetical protein
VSTRIIQAFGISESPIKIGDVFKDLGISYGLVSKAEVKIFHYATEQPALPIILPSVAMAKKYEPKTGRQVLFICDALVALSECNIRIIRHQDLRANVESALRFAVAHPEQDFQLVHKSLTTADYVNVATKPSYLNFIQTALYKISKYQLRKEVQLMIVQYLNSDIKLPALKAKLKSNLKLGDILTLVLDPRAIDLRSAVKAYKESPKDSAHLEQIAQEWGFDTFEILYVVNSASRNKDS